MTFTIRRVKIFLCLLIVFFVKLNVLGQEVIKYSNTQTRELIGKQISVFTDKSDTLTIYGVSKVNFEKSNDNVPNFKNFEAAYWIKLQIQNNTSQRNLLLEIGYPTIDSANLYTLDSSGKFTVAKLGRYKIFKDRFVNHQNFVFPVNINPGNSKAFYLKVKSCEPFQLPLYVTTESTLLTKSITTDLIFGIYIGIILIMAVYNLFIYFSTREKSYIFYVLYIISVGLSQFTLQGYSFKYLWPNNTWFALNGGNLVYAFSGIATVSFIIVFLQTKKNIAWAHRIFVAFVTVYAAMFLWTLVGKSVVVMLILQSIALFGSLFTFAIAIVLYRRNYKPAKFLLLAWSVFLAGLCIFVMRNFNILPYNNFTLYFLPVSSAVEVALLSFALADKINVYRDEKEQSQKNAMVALQENERLVREQNVVLEQKVKERTEELENTNTTLNVTLSDLKNTQSQLVDAEKMAALGQLTAGIAHEINNPINFVTANIKPLELDINDLREIISKYEALDYSQELDPQLAEIESFKKEIDLAFVNTEISSLLVGISEGAKRTTEIIRSLKNFSRLDESDMKPVDLNEGLESTLVLVRSNMPNNLKLVKELANLPLVECMPGKINQVFMNLITNALQAVSIKKQQNQEEFLSVKTWFDNSHVFISIKDSGIGMTEATQQRIFEPFFTTKDVGEGTGLGLSIVFGIIEKHKGVINVNSKFGEGTEFIIILPINQ